MNEDKALTKTEVAFLILAVVLIGVALIFYSPGETTQPQQNDTPQERTPYDDLPRQPIRYQEVQNGTG